MAVAGERNGRVRREARARAELRLKDVFIGMVILLAILALRLIMLQVIMRGHYLAVGEAIASSHKPGAPRRGSILARDLQPLAESSQVYSLFADPTKLAGDDECPDRIPETATAIARVLGMDREDIIAMLRRGAESGVRDRRIKRLLSDEECAAVEKLNLRDLYFKPEWRRTYHHGVLACHVIGRYNKYNEPKEGIEKRWDFVLAGRQGTARSDLDAFGRWIPGQDSSGALPTEHGRDLVLTIDAGLQAAAELALDRCMINNEPKWATCVVLDANTSEILVSASRPGFNPTRLTYDTDAERDRMLLNVPVSRTYEPGSIFKVLLAAAVLETNASAPDKTFYCGGVTEVGGKPLRCWGRWATNGGHRTCNLTRMLAQSCNIAAAQFAFEVGSVGFHDFLRSAGIGAHARTGMGAEVGGYLRPAAETSPRDLTSLGFGQGVRVNDIQLANAVAAVVNGGRLMQPHIVKAVLSSEDRQVIRAIEPVELGQVCSRETSAVVRRMLGEVVTGGTGGSAAIHPELPVGGKTGTAEKWDADAGRYMDKQNIVSFVMVAPLDDPRLVILVTADEPRYGRHGSDVAAPVARSIAITALRDADLLPAAIELEVDTALPGDN